MRIITKHARERMIEREIPPEVISETIERGNRVYLLNRKAFQYTLKTKTGSRFRVIVSAHDDTIITAFKMTRGPRMPRR